MAAMQELKSNCLSLRLLQLMLLVCFVLPLSEATGKVGVNYGTLGNNLPSAPEVANLLLMNTTLRNVKVYNPDSSIMQAFANTSINLIIGVPTESIPVLATNATSAQSWLQANIANYMPATQVTHLAVGNEVLMDSPSLSTQLLPAMVNLHAAILTLNLSLQVGTPHNLQVLEKSFPPSSGAFWSNLTTEMQAILGFLNATNGPLMVNLYPYFAYRNDPGNVPLAYVLFNTTTDDGFVTDANTGLRYSNMLDAQLDAVYSAMERMGFRNVPIVISETGWPSGGDLAANPANAQLYNMNLVKYVTESKGTPLRPGTSIDAYIFALFNENLKPGASSEQFFGLFNANRTPAYNLGLVMANATIPPSPNPNPNPNPIVPLPPPPPGNSSLYPPPATTTLYPPPANVTWYPPPANSTLYPPPAGPNLYPPPANPALYPPPANVTWYPPPANSTLYPPPANSTLYPPPAGPNLYPPPANPALYPPPANVTWYPPPANVTLYPPPANPTLYPPPAGLPPPPVMGPGPAASGPVSPGNGEKTWCVANAGAGDADVAQAMTYACGDGGVDCGVIQSGGACYYPNSVLSHASVVFNSYYQKMGRNYWNCYFGGTGLITIVDPSYPECSFH